MLAVFSFNVTTGVYLLCCIACLFVVVDTSSYDCDKVDVFSMKMMLAASKREIRCTYGSD